MSEACEELHIWANELPRFNSNYREEDIPKNGVYIVFERGEKAHGGDRIVRVGTHTGQDRLAKRLKEHMFTRNKDRSVFRKHIGRSLLAEDPFLVHWNLCLTSRANRARYADQVDFVRQQEVEANVTEYIVSNFEFVTIAVPKEADRRKLEESLLATVSQCAECRPSSSWLGLKHPDERIRRGLWNIQNLGGEPMTVSDIRQLMK